MAKSLAERVEWHAAQTLGLSALRSGFLSTFRLTLLALNGFDYLRGTAEIDAFMNELEVEWRVFATEEAALAAEAAELAGPFHYPLNIRDNRRPELGRIYEPPPGDAQGLQERLSLGSTCESLARYAVFAPQDELTSTAPFLHERRARARVDSS